MDQINESLSVIKYIARIQKKKSTSLAPKGPKLYELLCPWQSPGGGSGSNPPGIFSFLTSERHKDG